SDGHFVMGYYDQTDLPFYYWLASTFAISDHHFGATLGGTWANRGYLYAASSDSVMNTGQAINLRRNVFDQMTENGITWGSYSDGKPRQDCLGWDFGHEGVHLYSAGGDGFRNALEAGHLPEVSFVDPGSGQDEHPPANVQKGEAWVREIYETA